MTTKDHKKWKIWWLKVTRKEVRRRDWLAASNAYRSAAYHEAIVRSWRVRGKGLIL